MHTAGGSENCTALLWRTVKSFLIKVQTEYHMIQQIQFSIYIQRKLNQYHREIYTVLNSLQQFS